MYPTAGYARAVQVVDTLYISGHIPKIYPPERQVARARELPLRRLGDPMDVAEAVLFLAADSGRFVTGQCVDVMVEIEVMAVTD